MYACIKLYNRLLNKYMGTRHHESISINGEETDQQN